MKRRYSTPDSKTTRAALQRAVYDGMSGLLRRMAQIGRTEAEQLTWLTDLIARDLDDTTHDEVAADLSVFAAVRVHAWAGDVNNAAGFDNVPGIENVPGIQHPLAAEDVGATQQQLRDLLTTLAPGKTTVLAQPVGDGVYWGPDRVALVSQRGALMQVLAAAVDLLITIGPRLRRCETASCRRLFALKRPGQKRCRVTCGATERVRQWRAQHRPEVSERQHAKYQRKVKARQPLAQVKRRARTTGPTGVRKDR